MAPPNWNPRYVDQLVQLAIDNNCKGIIEEPRVLYGLAVIPTTDPSIAVFPNDTFVNGGEFPIRITQMTCAIRPGVDDGDFSFDDERLIQQVGLRLRYHDTFYMNNLFVPAPAWANKPVAAGSSTQQGTSSFIFDRPTVLSARDSLRVEVILERIAPTTPRLVSVGFTGVGLLSKRPYLFSSTLELDSLVAGVFPAADLKNDGGEPVALTDMSFTCGAERDANDPAGDIRRARFQVKLIGNGTQSDWFGTSAPGVSRCPGQLLGISTGRAIAHRFPGNGILLEPGDGLSAEANPLTGTLEGAEIGLALIGYVSVT